MHVGGLEPQLDEWRESTTLSRLANKNSELEFWEIGLFYWEQ